MKTKINIITLILIIVTFISCDNKGPAKPAEASIIFGLLDENNPWNTSPILNDTIVFSSLENTLMIDLIDNNITDPEHVEMLNKDLETDKDLIIRRVRIETSLDKELFTAYDNVFVPYGGGASMIMINEIAHYETYIGMRVPIKVNATPIQGNDTLELSTSELEFVNASYTSPISGLSAREVLYLVR